MTDIEYLEKYLNGENLDKAKDRLKNGEPVQYIIGNVDFCGYQMKVNKNVLIPRFETEELVENTINLLKKNNKYHKLNILEIGTGTGCISIVLKKIFNDSKIIATDISPLAIEIAKDNALQNNVDISFINTNLYDGIKEKFDCIISNPPYISKKEKIMDIVYKNEPHLALFADNDGLYFYEEILKNIKKMLKDKYIIAFEIGESQAEKINSIRKKYLGESKIIVKKDLQGRDRMIFIYNFE